MKWLLREPAGHVYSQPGSKLQQFCVFPLCSLPSRVLISSSCDLWVPLLETDKYVFIYLYITYSSIPSTELEAHALRDENISTFLSPYGARIVLGVGCSRALRQASAGPFLFLCSPVSLAMKLLSTLPEGRIRHHVITSHSQNFKTGRDHPAELPEPPGFLHEETETQR